MSFIPTINCIKVVIIGDLLGQQIVIDISIGTPTAPSISDLDDAADAVESWIDTELLPLLTTSLLIEEIKAYDMSSSTAPVVSHFISLAGDVVATSVQNNVALVASFRTDNRGRSGRGRNYIAGLPNNIGDTVKTTVGKAAAIAAAYSALNSYLAPLGFEHIVVSNFTGGAARLAGLKQTVNEYIVNVDYDSQRRRLAGRGA